MPRRLGGYSLAQFRDLSSITLLLFQHLLMLLIQLFRQSVGESLGRFLVSNFLNGTSFCFHPFALLNERRSTCAAEIGLYRL